MRIADTGCGCELRVAMYTYISIGISCVDCRVGKRAVLCHLSVCAALPVLAVSLSCVSRCASP